MAVSSIAALLSAITGMVTAGAGIWRPPVPIPAIKVVLVGPTAVPAAIDGSTRVSSSPVAIPTATPQSALPYQADWSTGMGGWTGSKDWAVVNGMLVNDGTHGGTTSMTVAAPDLFAGISDYAVEADIQVVKAEVYMPSFGFVTRATGDNTGYGVGFHYENGPGYNNDSAVIWQAKSGTAGTIAKKLFNPSTAWHHYLARMKGNVISEEIDGSAVLSATDNTYLTGNRIGLWSDRVQINVRNFKVTAV